MLYLYGDESSFGNAITYGLVIVDDKRLDEVEVALGEVKEMFGGKPSNRIHCRELFNKHARNKTEWSHLNETEVIELLTVTGNYLRTAGATFNLGHVDRAKLPPHLEIPMAGAAPVKILAEPKQLAAFAYTIALAGLENHKFHLWIDPDHTKIEWGPGRRQASRFPVTYEGLSITPEPSDGDKPMLLDVADVLAYSAAHFLSSTSPDIRFEKTFKAFGTSPRSIDFHHQVFPE